jgi:hypothetical protein
MGTAHRNHCPFCLWSKHVDDRIPGDRKSSCFGAMKPIGLTFKHEGIDKYGKKRQGEIMIVHHCTLCEKININRIAGDDDEKIILSLLDTSQIPENISISVSQSNITLLSTQHKEEVTKQLFGSKRL